MDSLLVECLNCGSTRIAPKSVFHRLVCPECPRCGYLGWASVVELSEAERRQLREQPLEQRGLRVA
jgi:hypothetical protein